MSEPRCRACAGHGNLLGAPKLHLVAQIPGAPSTGPAEGAISMYDMMRCPVCERAYLIERGALVVCPSCGVTLPRNEGHEC